MALERGAGPERHDRRVVRGANSHRVDHIFARFGEDHGVGRCGLDPSQGVAVLAAHRFGGREGVPESRGERVRQVRDDAGGEATLAVAQEKAGFSGHRRRISHAFGRRADVLCLGATQIGNPRAARAATNAGQDQ